MAPSASQKRLVISYVFWLAGFVMPVAGLHRLYNRKIGTGLLWLFTWGLFGVGQFVDVFFVPGMAEEHELKRLKAKYGDDIYNLLNTPSVTTQTIQQPTQQERMVTLLRAAQRNAGQLSVTQAVMDTGMSFEEAESLLQDMVKSGYVGVDNHPKTGVVVYQFHEMLA
ncbi:MAG: NINE protein [Leptolyngbyaceae cyanobacterium]